VSSLNKSIKAENYKLVSWQLFVIMGLALVLFLLQGLQSSISALLGGLAYCLPNFFFVWRAFAHTSVHAIKQFIMNFFIAEVSKLFLSAALFVLIVKYLPVRINFVLSGYVAAILAFWVVSFFFMSRQAGVAK
jgi:ATP synthase protein I